MIYVMSDIHGNIIRFNSVLKQINLKESDTLYVLGDVIDRGPDGIKILRKIMKMPNVKMLLGNHEHMMLEALAENVDESDIKKKLNQERKLSQWYSNDGRVTHNSFKHLRKEYRLEILD